MEEIMDKIANAIKLAMDKFEEEQGKMEVGDEFVTVFNDCVLVISYEEGGINTHFIGGKPYIVDKEVGIYEGQQEGIETDDECQWERYRIIDGIQMYQTSCLHEFEEQFTKMYKFCPHCGKKIKVVE